MDAHSIEESEAAGTPHMRLVAERIDTLVREIGELADPRARDDAAELVRLLMDLYGAALQRVLAIAADGAGGRGTLVDALCDDALVSSLLVLHGLHPVDLATRVGRSVGRVQAALASQGVQVTMASASEAEVRVGIESAGGGHLCGSTTAAARSAVERAIADAAPEVQRVTVEIGHGRAKQGPLMQIQGLKRAGER